ncbi:hypothetical protein ACRALDRAFT_1077904 [Sodiomyces alcalophilus JCM 7366]|uniref:uncharacterized protein n=1 Tax=Sodiomyces alcalophilus JCM 7366 TaxID=591952 RepID=UPI0039B36595
MGSLWNVFSGQRSSSRQDSATPSAPLHEPHTSFQTPTTSSSSSSHFDPSAGQGVEAFLQNSSFTDPSQLHPLAGLNKDTLEYLTLEDGALSQVPGSQSVIPSRGFTDDLCYGTGISYLSALGIGGALGMREGLSRSVGQPPKLRLNAVLNGMTRRGPFLGNSAGVIAITYNCINSAISHFRGKHDAASTIAAGGLSGMLFKSTKGLRPMLISGGIVATVAGAWAVVRTTLVSPPAQQAEEELATL